MHMSDATYIAEEDEPGGTREPRVTATVVAAGAESVGARAGAGGGVYEARSQGLVPDRAAGADSVVGGVTEVPAGDATGGAAAAV